MLGVLVLGTWRWLLGSRLLGALALGTEGRTLESRELGI